MTVPRYIAIVAAIYLVVMTAVFAFVGGMGDIARDSPMRLLYIPGGAILLAIFGTVVPIVRFGNAAGSVYFLPTVLHSFVIVALVVICVMKY